MIVTEQLPGKRIILSEFALLYSYHHGKSNRTLVNNSKSPGSQFLSGCIRSVSKNFSLEKLDCHNLKITVELDNGKVEELKISKVWSRLLIETILVEVPRKTSRCPALVFQRLFDKSATENVYVQYFGSKEVERISCRLLYPFRLKEYKRDSQSTVVLEDLSLWLRVKKTQLLLLNGPYTLSPCQLKVYNLNGDPYYATLTEHNLFTRKLTVLHKEKLESIHVDPQIVHVIICCSDYQLDKMLLGQASRQHFSRHNSNIKVQGAIKDTSPSPNMIYLNWSLPSWMENVELYKEQFAALKVNHTQSTKSSSEVEISSVASSVDYGVLVHNIVKRKCCRLKNSIEVIDYELIGDIHKLKKICANKPCSTRLERFVEISDLPLDLPLFSNSLCQEITSCNACGTNTQLFEKISKSQTVSSFSTGNANVVMEDISDGEPIYSYNINDTNIVPIKEISKKNTKFSCNVDKTNNATVESFSNIQTVYSCNKNGSNVQLMKGTSKTKAQTCYSSNINIMSIEKLSKSQTIPLFNKDNGSVVMEGISDGELTYSRNINDINNLSMEAISKKTATSSCNIDDTNVMSVEGISNIQTFLYNKDDNNVSSMEGSSKTQTSSLCYLYENSTDSLQNNTKCRKNQFILEQSTLRISNVSQVSKCSFFSDKITPNADNLLCTTKDTSRGNYAELQSYEQKKNTCFKVACDEIKSSTLSYKNCTMLLSNNFTSLYGVPTTNTSCISYSQTRSICNLPRLLKVEVNDNCFASDQQMFKAFNKSYALMELPSSYFKFNSFLLLEKKHYQLSHSSSSPFVFVDDLSSRANKELPRICNNYLNSNEFSGHDQTLLLNVMILMAKKSCKEYQFISYMQGYMAHHQLTRDFLIRELTEFEPSMVNQIMKSQCFLLALDVPSLIGNETPYKKWTLDPTLNWSEIFVMIKLFLESCKKTVSKMKEDTLARLKSKNLCQSVSVDKCFVVKSNQISYHTTSPVLPTSLMSSKKYFSTANNSPECIANELVSQTSFDKKTFCNSPVICNQVLQQKESIDFEIYSQNPTQNQFQDFVKTSTQLNEKKKQDEKNESFLNIFLRNRKISVKNPDSNFDCNLTKVSTGMIQMIKSRQSSKAVAEDITTRNITSFLVTPDSHCAKIPCVEFSDEVVLHPYSKASDFSPKLHLTPAHAKKTLGSLDQKSINDNQKNILEVVQNYSPLVCYKKTYNAVDRLSTENNISTLDNIDKKSKTDIDKDFEDAIKEYTLFCFRNSKRNKANLKRNKANLTNNYLDKSSSSHSKRFKTDQLPDIGTKRVMHTKISEILKQEPNKKLTAMLKSRNRQSLNLIASSTQSGSQIFSKFNKRDLCFSQLILSNTKQNKKMNATDSCVSNIKQNKKMNATDSSAELFTLGFTSNQSSTVKSILDFDEKSLLQYNPDMPSGSCFKNCFKSLSPPWSPKLLGNFLSNKGFATSSSVQMGNTSFLEKKFSKIGKVIHSQNVKPVNKRNQQVMPVCPDNSSNLLYYINCKKTFQVDKPNRLVKYLDFDFFQHLKNQRIIEITDLDYRNRFCNQLFKMYPSCNLQDSKIAVQNSHLLESYNYSLYQNDHTSTLAVTKTIFIPLKNPTVFSESVSSINSDVACNLSLVEEEKKKNCLVNLKYPFDMCCTKSTLCSNSVLNSTEYCSSVLCCSAANNNIQPQQNLNSSAANILSNLDVDKTKEVSSKATRFDCSISKNFRVEKSKKTRQLKDEKSYCADNHMHLPVTVVDCSLLDATSNSLKSLTDEGSPTSVRTAKDVLFSKPSHECLEKDKTPKVCLVNDNQLSKKPKLKCLEQISTKTPASVYSNINTVLSLKSAQLCLKKVSGYKIAPECFEKTSSTTNKGGLKRKKTDLDCDQKIANKKKISSSNFKVPVEPLSTNPTISNDSDTETCKLLTSGLGKPYTTTAYRLSNATKSEHNDEVFDSNVTSATYTTYTMEEKVDESVNNSNVPFQNSNNKASRKRLLVKNKIVSPKKVKKSFKVKEKSKSSQIQQNINSARRSQRSITTDTIMRIKECHKKEEANEEDIPYQSSLSDSSSMHSKISLLNSNNKDCSFDKNTSESSPIKNDKDYDTTQQGVPKVVLTDCNNPNRNQNFTNQNRKLPDSHITDDRTHKEKTNIERKKKKYWYPEETNKINQQTVCSNPVKGLQMKSCRFYPELPMCIDCQENAGETYCRFIMFRRLDLGKTNGFCTPDDAITSDLVHWIFDHSKTNLDVNICKQILENVGAQFQQLVHEESEAVKWGGKLDIVAWKRAVLQVREMCDICATTMFNTHWICDRCGFAVCLDCFLSALKYEDDKGERHNLWPSCQYSGELCSHKTKQLTVTQIIPRKVLYELCDDLLSVCKKVGLKFRDLDLLEFSHPKHNLDPNRVNVSDDFPSALEFLASIANFESQENIKNESRHADCNSINEHDKECRWFCNNRMLHILMPHFSQSTMLLFQKEWQKGAPVIVSNVHKFLNEELWSPDAFNRDFGHEFNDVVNCLTGKILENFPIDNFWRGFESVTDRPVVDGSISLLKLKDWPSGEDFQEKLPERYQDLIKALPAPCYTHRNGQLNLAARLPDFFAVPDLGPKMYNAYGSASHASAGTTNLHLDISDATNVIVYVGIPREEEHRQKEISDAIKIIDSACCEATRSRIRELNVKPGALWHIFPAHSAEKIRQFLRRVSIERGIKLNPYSDPIHDQSFYLDKELLDRLQEEEGVVGFAICQCLGDAVFIPAGAPHQVLNLHSCIKVAEDFVGPEHMSHCIQLTQEFRHLSDFHTNHEDKLQVKNILFHTVKDCLGVMKQYYNL